MKLYNRRPALGITASCLAAVLLSSCMANPGDAPTVEGQEAPEKAAPEAKDREQQLREVTIGVDEFVEGFNPHLIADSSPLTDLVSALTLPSVFVPDANQPDRLVLNEDLLASVVATTSSDSREREARGGEAATHVRYVIRQGAQWSDGTPISGEDFRYLYTKLTSTPGAARAASYDVVKRLDVSDGGRQVDITFSEPVVNWQELFQNLLPAHLLRSSTDGFDKVLDTMLPASGSRYTVQSIDVGRNIVRLVRNDRFWGAHPALTETVVIRAVRNSVDGAAQLRTDQLQAVQVRPQETTALTYGLVPSAREFTQQTARRLSLVANMSSTRLYDAAVRRDVLGRVDVRQVRAVATGRALEADAPEDTTPTLTGSAHVGVIEGVTEGKPLRIGVMTGDNQAAAAANAIADQLSASGVPAVVDKASPLDLSRSLLPYGLVDLVVSWNESTDSMGQARDRYLCPSASVPSLEPKAELEQQSKEQTASATASASGTVSETTARKSEARQGGKVEDPSARLVSPHSTARTGNLSGLCDPELDKLLVAGLPEVPEEARRLVKQHAIELPLVSDEILTVIGAGVTRELEPDPQIWPSAPYIGKLMTIPVWQRVLPTAGENHTTQNNSKAKVEGE